MYKKNTYIYMHIIKVCNNNNIYNKRKYQETYIKNIYIKNLQQ